MTRPVVDELMAVVVNQRQTRSASPHLLALHQNTGAPPQAAWTRPATAVLATDRIANVPLGRRRGGRAEVEGWQQCDLRSAHVAPGEATRASVTCLRRYDLLSEDLF